MNVEIGGRAIQYTLHRFTPFRLAFKKQYILQLRERCLKMHLISHQYKIAFYFNTRFNVERNGYLSGKMYMYNLYILHILQISVLPCVEKSLLKSLFIVAFPFISKHRQLPAVSTTLAENLPPVSTKTRWQIMGTMSDCLHLKVNLKKKNIQM